MGINPNRTVRCTLDVALLVAAAAAISPDLMHTQQAYADTMQYAYTGFEHVHITHTDIHTTHGMIKYPILYLIF